MGAEQIGRGCWSTETFQLCSPTVTPPGDAAEEPCYLSPPQERAQTIHLAWARSIYASGTAHRY